MSYLLNARSKTVHCSDFADKRCRLEQQNPENVMEFSSLEEALLYFPNPQRVKKCPFCLGKNEKAPGTDR